MTYLVGTIVRDGKAVAVTGFVMNSDLTGWTKHPRRIEWSDIVTTWRRQPTAEEVKRAKTRLPIAAAGVGA
jgi:hypothetical protein